MGVLLTGAAVLMLAGAGAWLLQPKLLFQPYAELVGVPSAWGLAYEDIRLTTSDGVRLHAWFLPAERRRSAPHTLLFLHGNAGNISHRSASLTIFADLGLDQLIIDYRGYGQSDGKPTEAGLYLDADAAWRWLTKVRGVQPRDIVVFGRSLGGAVATQLAARAQPGALIIESSFTDLASMARRHHPLMARLVPLRYRLPSAEHLAGVRSPVLVLHSRDDGIVPFAHGQALYAAAPGPKRFVELVGGHNDGFLDSQPHYQHSLADFLDRPPGP